MIKLWKDSKKDANGWAYESEVAQNFLKAMNSLAYELALQKTDFKIYEEFFVKTTNQVKSEIVPGLIKCS